MESEKRIEKILLKFKDQYISHLKNIETVNLNLLKIDQLIESQSVCRIPAADVKLIKKDLILMKNKSNEDEENMRTRWTEIRDSCALNLPLIDTINKLISTNKISIVVQETPRKRGRPKKQRCNSECVCCDTEPPTRSEPNSRKSVGDSPRYVPSPRDQDSETVSARVESSTDKTNKLSTGNNSLNMSPAPRKRGRPKKQRCNSECVCCDTEPPPRSEPNSQKSVGDSPRDVLCPRDEEPETSAARVDSGTDKTYKLSTGNNCLNMSPAPRKRGRPKKQRCDSECVYHDSEPSPRSEPNSQNSVGDSPRDVLCPRDQESETSAARVDSSNNSLNMSPAPPRKRGRPKKKISCNDNCVCSEEGKPCMCDRSSQQSSEHSYKDDPRALQKASVQGVIEENDEQLGIKSLEVNNEVPIKRGRPRKEISCNFACVGCNAERV